MPGRIVVIPTDAEIAAAFASPQPDRGPRATAVSYRPASDEVRLVLAGAVTLLVPRTAIVELRDLPKSYLRRLRLTPGGGAVALDRDDVHISVPGLVRDLVGFRSANRRKAPAA
jgi:hypothetical protein